MAQIDTRALAHNLEQVRRAAPGAKVMAIIKADGYGHDVGLVASALAGAEALAVARLGAAVTIRRGGYRGRVVLLEGLAAGEDLAPAARHDLDLVIHEPGQLAQLERYRGDHRFAVWLKFDSGMNRLGFRDDGFGDALARLERCRAVRRPLTLMTHLANADERDDDTTLRQIERFEGRVAGIEGERSIANSAGVMAWPCSHGDWVRPGIMLYGISPFADDDGSSLGLAPAMTFRSELIAVKPVRRGEAVGYGGEWVVPRDTVLGVAAVGYGDGYPGNLPSGTPVLVNDREVALVGRVSMDMITVDLGAAAAAVGDPVVLWGPGLPVERIARCAGRLRYELVCGISKRVLREAG